MGDVEVSTRDLRNHTARVLDDVAAGTTVFITRHGRRVAALTSLTHARHPANAQLLTALAAHEPYDSGMLDELAAARLAEAGAEPAKQALLGEDD